MVKLFFSIDRKKNTRECCRRKKIDLEIRLMIHHRLIIAFLQCKLCWNVCILTMAFGKIKSYMRPSHSFIFIRKRFERQFSIITWENSTKEKFWFFFLDFYWESFFYSFFYQNTISNFFYDQSINPSEYSSHKLFQFQYNFPFQRIGFTRVCNTEMRGNWNETNNWIMFY